MFKKLLLVVAGAILFAGCKGAPPNPVAPPPTNIPIVIADNSRAMPTNLALATPPPPLDPVNNPYVNASPFPTSPPVGKSINSSAMDGWPKSKPLDPTNNKSTNAIQDGSGQLGNASVNTNYMAYYVANTGYAAAEINTSGDTKYNNYLFAPTTKQGNGCVETSMTYTRYVNIAGAQNQTTLRLLRAYDFCLNGGSWTNYYKVVDATFQATYERDLGNGVPQYVIEEFPTTTGAWAVVLYNFTASNWELLYVSQPGTNDYNGAMTWNMFEMHYSVGPCTIFPPVISSNFQHYDITTHQWVGTDNTNIYLQAGNIPFPNWGACTLPDSTGPATNTIGFSMVFSTWRVDSYGFINANGTSSPTVAPQTSAPITSPPTSTVIPTSTPTVTQPPATATPNVSSSVTPAPQGVFTKISQGSFDLNDLAMKFNYGGTNNYYEFSSWFNAPSAGNVTTWEQKGSDAPVSVGFYSAGGGASSANGWLYPDPGEGIGNGTYDGTIYLIWTVFTPNDGSGAQTSSVYSLSSPYKN